MLTALKNLAGIRHTSSRISSFSTGLTLTILLLFSASAVSADAEMSNADMNIITRITANILSREHFNKQPLDDELSKKLFKAYLKTLDSMKIFFTQEDILRFSKYETTLDNQIQEGNLTGVFEMYDTLVKRMEQYQDFASKAIDKGFDYTKNEDFIFDRKNAAYPSEAEQKEIWRKKVKYDLLQLRLADKVIKEEKAKNPEDAKKIKMAKLWNTTPEKRLKKRNKTAVLYLKNKHGIDKLAIFLDALTRVYDPHSSYMAPKQAENFNIGMTNALYGIGAVLTSVDGYTRIEKIIKGGPADKEGHLKSEDRIVAVAQGDEEPVDVVDMPLDDVVQLIRGKKGTVVRLHVLKGKNGLHGVPEEISIVRDKVELKDQDASSEIKVVEVNGEKTRIGVIDLPSFYIDFVGASAQKPDYKSSTRDMKRILEKFTEQQVDGVILDLRRNGGGSLLEAIRITGLFIKSGPVVQEKRANKDVPIVESDYDRNVYFTGPLIVLISKYSASAAEIFAAAIQDYGRGIIVGDHHSHGKGTVQQIYDLNKFLKLFGLKTDPGDLKLTIAKFYRINGETTQMKGVVSDITLPSLLDPMKIGEKYLDYALPWDTITPAHYEHTDLTPLIKNLKDKSKHRIGKNKDFQERKQLIALYKNLNDRKKVSLNEKERWKQYLEDKKVLETKTALFDKDRDKNKKDKPKDIVLNEAVNILRDWLSAEQKKGTSGF